MTRTHRFPILFGVMLALVPSLTVAQGISRSEYEKMVRAHKAQAIEELSSDSPTDRYFALMALLSCAELPDKVVAKIIACLGDLRGMTPGNSVAVGAAGLLTEHPQYARRAIPELITLLKHEGGYSYAANAAARALGAVGRRHLEKYVSDLGANGRKSLATELIEVLSAASDHRRALVCELYCLLGPDAIDVLDVVESKTEGARQRKKGRSETMLLRMRAESALKIIQNGWKIGESRYLAEMRRVDTALGKLDPYVEAENRFSAEWRALLALMKRARVKNGYVIRHDNSSFPFQARKGGVPMGRLITNVGYHFLFNGLDLTGRQLPQKPIVLLTAKSKQAYRHTFDARVNPKYSPPVQDFLFIEIGVNGEDPLDAFLKTLGITEGYDEDFVYVYWPNSWWRGARQVFKRPSGGKKIRWLKIVDGELEGAGLVGR